MAYPYLGEKLRAMGLDVCELTDYDYPTPEDEVLAAVTDADIYVVGVEKVNKRVIDNAPRLKLIIKHGAGYDNIDVDYAKEKGILVTFAAGKNCGSVAELAMGLILSAARGITTSYIRLRDNNWALYMGDELEGKTLGIVGFGAIGQRLAKYAKAFDMDILAYDPYVEAAICEANGASKTDFDTILRESDFISLHIPATQENIGLINKDAFAKMKTTSYLINTSRGEVVDEDALIAALKSGEIKAAALDVFSSEPPRGDLISVPNVLATPHIGGSSIGGARNLCEHTCENIRRFLNGEPLLCQL